MKFLIVLFFVSTALLLLNNCDSTDPVDELQPGRRDYTWTVDTLNGLYNPRYRMWGSSPTDIWATTSSNWENSISHFDGSRWISYGISGLAGPSTIYGFSNTQVYVGEAGSGRIWKYDGNNWNQYAQLTKDGHNNIWIANIWGQSPNDFYAFGAYPDSTGYINGTVIAHYLSGNWEMLNTNDLYGIVTDLYKNSPDNKTYLLVIGGTNFTDSTKVYELIQGGYQFLYGNVWTKGVQADISLINKEVIFVLGNQIARRTNDQFQTILNVNNPNFYQRIWGRNTKDIFLLMTDGLAHCNGTDVEYLFYFTLGNEKPWSQIYGATIFKDEVLFLAYEPQTGLSLIYHGRLN